MASLDDQLSKFDQLFTRMSSLASSVFKFEQVSFSGNGLTAITVDALWVHTERSEKATVHGIQVSYVATVIVAASLFPGEPRQGMLVRREKTGVSYRAVGKILFVESDQTWQISLDSIHK